MCVGRLQRQCPGAPGGRGLAWRVLTPFTSPLGSPQQGHMGFTRSARTIWGGYWSHRLATGTSDRSWLGERNVVSIKGNEARGRMNYWEVGNSTRPTGEGFRGRLLQPQERGSATGQIQRRERRLASRMKPLHVRLNTSSYTESNAASHSAAFRLKTAQYEDPCFN